MTSLRQRNADHLRDVNDLSVSTYEHQRRTVGGRQRRTTTVKSSRQVADKTTLLPSSRRTFLILTLLSTVCCVEGCWKRRSAPASATVMSPEATTDSSPKLECTSDEAFAANCLNDGVCFVVQTIGQRVSGCVCTSEWVGQNCERRFVDPDYWAASHQLTVCTTVGIIVGVFGLVIVVVLAIVVAYLCRRHRSRTGSYDTKRQQPDMELPR